MDIAEFKAHIAAIVRANNPEQFVKSPADRPCVRTPEDAGYYPPPRKVGSGQRTINQDDSTVIVERPKTEKTNQKGK